MRSHPGRVRVGFDVAGKFKLARPREGADRIDLMVAPPMTACPIADVKVLRANACRDLRLGLCIFTANR